jgi:hypothetical protein
MNFVQWASMIAWSSSRRMSIKTSKVAASDQAQFPIPAVTEGLTANDEDFVVHQGRIARGLLAAFQEDVPLRVQSKFADVALLAGQRPDDRFS